MGPFIDSHCHLTHDRLAGQVQAVLDRAARAGVVTMICASSDLAESRRSQQLARLCDRVYFTAGLGPHEAAEAGEKYLAALEALAGDPRCVALGECGLDYHYDFSPRPVQQRVFAEQLALARRLGQKVVVHTREALADTLAIVRDSGLDAREVVFHSFTEPLPGAQAVLDTGAMIGLSGIVTFARSDPLRRVAAAVPADRLLIETDSPYLSPEPVREMKTNEPANVVHVASCLAGARGVSCQELAERTTHNARRFFDLGISSAPGIP
ncbi:MAG: TatD family hydrolase [Phycisphaerae bacterium]|nr:TatD family hydrolase [Phycisphaerae bacterium]